MIKKFWQERGDEGRHEERRGDEIEGRRQAKGMEVEGEE